MAATVIITVSSTINSSSHTSTTTTITCINVMAVIAIMHMSTYRARVMNAMAYEIGRDMIATTITKAPITCQNTILMILG